MFQRAVCLLFVSIILMFTIIGCVYKSDVRPTNQCPSFWECKETDIELVIPLGNKESNVNNIETLDPICTITIDGKPQKCNMVFDYGNGVTMTLEDNRSMTGNCTYNENSFIINVTSDTIYNGKFKTLTFFKVTFPS